MTHFSLIAAELQYHLVGVLFLAAMCELALCLYEQICCSGWKRRAMDGALFIAALMLCAYTMTAARYPEYYAALPWLTVPLVAALLAVRAVAGMRRVHKTSGNAEYTKPDPLLWSR